jgi:hypothetical protein
MRPKCSVRDDQWGLCLGKFPSVTDERAYTKGEVLALHLARHAGITVADARLVDSDGVPVALIRRFDRVPDPSASEDRARELKTWISEETGPEASIEALVSTARYFGISLDRVAMILGEVERAVAGWRTVAGTLGLTADEIDSFTDAFEHRERVAAQRRIGGLA